MHQATVIERGFQHFGFRSLFVLVFRVLFCFPWVAFLFAFKIEVSALRLDFQDSNMEA